MDESKHNDLNMPEPISTYLVMTLNQRGPVSSYLDDYAQQFIHFAVQQKSPVLELGAAYGFVTIAALTAGATVIANDIEPRHLQILYNRTPKECRDRLSLLPGEFPSNLNLANESIAGCYISRMLGYLEPAELQQGMEKLFLWLKPGAKLFVLASPPYRSLYKAIIPIYEQRIKDNEQWPGYFTNLKNLLEERLRRYVPNKLHFLDEKILSREVERVGFIVEKAELYARQDLPEKAQYDGREGIAVIARKP
ncbi:MULTISPECIES: class I SAM-dependent methyltransferase [Legionella]|uniref:Putative Methyltransferase n=1 Tax=Legionella maceachernii TaxID=466 RepID=A0A0W0W6J3_9GAMM|nr:class I SAM-dependent methyltransferase [Legionella maceachernii]KTD27949.1 putative Methyltransferase [Legionella maceachernii]SKA25923.1 polyketide synthase PksJ [Legionella maceachernii]SUO99988.1 Uncharacterised protein [Legionella maceachernii]